MEWIFWIVLGVMLALLCYTIFWTSIALHKKSQPAVDSFFDAVYALRDLNTKRKGEARVRSKVV